MPLDKPPKPVEPELPDLEPFERHIYSCKEMERVILEAELEHGDLPSAKDVVCALLDHVFTVSLCICLSLILRHSPTPLYLLENTSKTFNFGRSKPLRATETE